MGCCANCFNDRGLSRQIFPMFSTTAGTCSYCNHTNTVLIEPSELRNYFSLLVSVYIPNEDGRLLVELLREDWRLFTSMDNAHAKDLLGDILDDGEIVRGNFAPSDLYHSHGLGQWESLCTELMYENRFFPKAELDHNRLETLLSHLLLDHDEISPDWFRARIQHSESPFPLAEMGAPPKRKASQGRANPAGIPYLYLASNATTAISEIRPHTGEVATVADFSIQGSVAILDLRDPRTTVSPFLLEDETEIALLRGDIAFLERLGEELTRPVLPHAAAIDYIPSQYLCEFIKNCGFDGVMYRSSVGDGVNLALFDPAKAQPASAQQKKVARVSVELASESTELSGRN